MLHLGIEGIIHKDLAARNVLVTTLISVDWILTKILQITETFTAKVGDFGLSRLSNVKNDALQVYIGQSNTGPLRYIPTIFFVLLTVKRWMSIEAAVHKIYSVKSDGGKKNFSFINWILVWSFGMTVIEILTRNIPYPQLTLGTFICFVKWKMLKIFWQRSCVKIL